MAPVFVLVVCLPTGFRFSVRSGFKYSQHIHPAEIKEKLGVEVHSLLIHLLQGSHSKTEGGWNQRTEECFALANYILAEIRATRTKLISPF